MDSSKTHWPSMFKSKSSVSSQGHQSENDTSSLISTPTSTISSGTSVEKGPEPKPRWNPKPEQIRILEGIFNSGMVTPPRDEIRRIRAQLQEYGEVGDANVFYWFQNRKSRSKNKKTSNFLHSTTKTRRRTFSKPNTSPFSYTYSSDKSMQKSSSGEFVPEPSSFQASESTFVGGAIAGNAAVGTPLNRGLCFPQVISSNIDYVAQYNISRHNVSECDGQTYGKCSAASVIVTDHLINHEATSNYYKREEDNDKMKMQQQLSYHCATTSSTPISAQTILPPAVMSNINHIQGDGIRKCTVFINDVAFEVASGPFDVRGAFGEDVVLLHSSGQPVVTNQWGVTLHSLQHGAFYYLFRMRNPSSTSHTHSSGQYLV